MLVQPETRWYVFIPWTFFSVARGTLTNSCTSTKLTLWYCSKWIRHQLTFSPEKVDEKWMNKRINAFCWVYTSLSCNMECLQWVLGLSTLLYPQPQIPGSPEFELIFHPLLLIGRSFHTSLSSVTDPELTGDIPCYSWLGNIHGLGNLLWGIEKCSLTFLPKDVSWFI